MRNAVFVPLSLLAAMSACAAAPVQAQQDEAVIRQNLADWLKAFNDGDYAKAVQIWAPDMRGWGDGMEDSYERERGAAKKMPKAMGPKARYQLRIDEVMVEGDMAVVHDTWTEIGPTGRTRTFPSFEVWRRQPDQTWKISRWIDGASTPDSGVK